MINLIADHHNDEDNFSTRLLWSLKKSTDCTVPEQPRPMVILVVVRTQLDLV